MTWRSWVLEGNTNEGLSSHADVVGESDLDRR